MHRVQLTQLPSSGSVSGKMGRRVFAVVVGVVVYLPSLLCRRVFARFDIVDPTNPHGSTLSTRTHGRLDHGDPQDDDPPTAVKSAGSNSSRLRAVYLSESERSRSLNMSSSLGGSCPLLLRLWDFLVVSEPFLGVGAFLFCGKDNS